MKEERNDTGGHRSERSLNRFCIFRIGRVHIGCFSPALSARAPDGVVHAILFELAGERGGSLGRILGTAISGGRPDNHGLL